MKTEKTVKAKIGGVDVETVGGDLPFGPHYYWAGVRVTLSDGRWSHFKDVADARYTVSRNKWEVVRAEVKEAV